MATFITSLSNVFNSGATPTAYSGYTVDCSPSMTNKFYVNINQTVGNTVTITSNVHWLHINKTVTYVGNAYTSIDCTFNLDYNSIVNGRTGTIKIVTNPSLGAKVFTITQNGIPPTQMSETELDNWLVTREISETSGTSGTSGPAGTSGISGTSGKTGLDGSSGTSGDNGTSGTSGSV